MTALAPAVESFFTGYLIAQRGASPHTIASYRDTFRLLFAWIREQTGTRPSDLDFADVDAAAVTGFLAMLEDERHNTGRTRSQRLAAIHSLFRHAALGHPEHDQHIEVDPDDVCERPVEDADAEPEDDDVPEFIPPA